MSEEKELTRGEQLRRALVYERKNGWDRLDAEEGAALEAYCTGYKQFLDAGKTERECVDRAIAQAEAAGFRAYVRGMELKPGDRIYQVNRDKAIMLAVMGRKGLEHGVNIGAAHIDSPRLDLKQNPLYESDELGFFKTHYYGGIRKYQWVTIPLELHGVVALKNGEVVRVSVGNGPDDPMFTIDDLLPHLATDQVKKPLGEAIPAESLNILVGSRPLRDDEGSDRVKLSVLELLNRKYGIVEEDFLSAELCAGPRLPGGGHRLRPLPDRRLRPRRPGVRLCLPGRPAPAGHAGAHRRVHAGGQGGDRLRGGVRHEVQGLRHLHGATCARARACPCGPAMRSPSACPPT